MSLLRYAVFAIIQKNFPGSALETAGKAADEIMAAVEGGTPGPTSAPRDSAVTRAPSGGLKKGQVLLDLADDPIAAFLLGHERFTSQTALSAGYTLAEFENARKRLRKRSWVDMYKVGRDYYYKPTQAGIDAKMEFDTRPKQPAVETTDRVLEGTGT